MILIELTGNCGEGSSKTLRELIKMLANSSNTKRIFVFDETREIMYYLKQMKHELKDVGFSERIIGVSTESLNDVSKDAIKKAVDKELFLVFNSGGEDKIIVVDTPSYYPYNENVDFLLGIKDFMETVSEVNCHEQIYCIYYNCSIPIAKN